MIDTHTHVYPDKMALKAVDRYHSKEKTKVPLSGDFTLRDLRSYMERVGIEAVVAFCVAGRPEAVRSANDYLIEITDNRQIFGFGTILPQMEDPVSEVRRISDNGIKGIKFHPLIQPIEEEDEALLPIYQEMEKKGMIAHFHVGKDINAPFDPPRASSRYINRLKELFPDLTIIAAHFGGLLVLEEARKWVIGKDIYIDTAWCPNIMVLKPEEVVRIIGDHGVERVLFATDYPTTTDPEPQIQWLRNLLDKEERDLIFHDNARRLLKGY